MSSWKADLQQQNNGVLRKDIIISKKKRRDKTPIAITILPYSYHVTGKWRLGVISQSHGLGQLRFQETET